MIADCLDGSGAKQVAETAQALIPLGRSMLAGIQRQMVPRQGRGSAGPTPQENLRQTMNTAFAVVGQFLDSVKITQQESEEHVTADADTGTLPIMVAREPIAAENA